MSDTSTLANDLGTLLSSLILVGLATIVALFLLKPSPFPQQPQAQQRRHENARYSGTARGGAEAADNDPNNKSAPLEPCTRTPEHVTATSGALAHSGGANLLVDGLIAFRHTQAAAAAATTTTSEDDATAVRKDRARVLTRLVMMQEEVQGASAAQPPPKGGTLLIAVPFAELDCDKLRRVLYLLATYYNLLLVIAVEAAAATTEQQPSVPTLRKQRDAAWDLLCGGNDSGSQLAAVLPRHRVLTATTSAGRIALARQLQRVELYLEFDESVRQSLARFGHAVVLYNATTGAAAATSGSVLGDKLLP